ncbi:MAG: exo-alpha-sialidase, partial [Prosthecobacter sp.]|uniref:exo-alpha-sialidase n=1 Tax=Prosthecobacter sp. TaxID=1965333 RepID=UPI003BAF34B5
MIRLTSLLCGALFVTSLLPAADATPAAIPAVPQTSPGPAYADSARLFQGVSGIERAPNGRLWATWYGGGLTEDHENYILLSTSGDDGRTWQTVMVLDPDAAGPVRAFDPCLWHDPDGKLWLFWGQEMTQPKGRDFSTFVTFAITTADSGSATAPWSAPRRISHGVMMNKPTVTKDSRWLLPLSSWYTDGSSRAVVSTDHGQTFTELGAANLPDKKSRNADEQMIIERKDASLWMLVRGKFATEGKGSTGLGESTSTDGGKSWSDVKASAIPHLTTRFFIRRLASGRLLLVRQNPPAGFKGRSHLTAFLSDDDGHSWQGGLLLDERDGACYPDGVQSADGRISVIYDFQRGKDKEILMALFTEDEVLAGRLTAPTSRLRVLVNKATGVKKTAPVTAQTWPLDAVDAPIQVHGGRPKVAPGAHGKSLVLDGKTVIELKDTAALNGETGFTFSVWLNPHVLDAGQQIIAAKNRYSLKERQWSLAVEEGGILRAYLQQDKWRTITAKPLLQAGHWHHVALTVSATQAVLYLNGRPVGKTPLSKPLPATQAPITLGGVKDGDRLTQQLHGAVDDARFISRVLTAAEIAKTYRPVTATQQVPKPIAPSDTPLWDATAKLPKAAEAPVLDGVVFHVIQPHAPEKDGYIWLHGVGLGWHKGRLYASFGHNKGEENTPGEQARGRVSSDGGQTWADTFTIGAGESDDHAVSHGVFLSHDGALWSFHGSFYGHHLTDIDSSKVHTRAYRLNETTGKWESQGTVIQGGFWPLQEPVKMTDGNWIMSGISVGHGHPAAVAISHGADFTQWDLVVIPAAEGLSMWGESSVIVDGANITNIARYGAKPQALISLSKDHGRTWSTTAPSNLPMATSKP